MNHDDIPRTKLLPNIAMQHLAVVLVVVVGGKRDY